MTTQSETDSQSSYETGGYTSNDPEGGPSFVGFSTLASITTTQAYGGNHGTETFGPLGGITSGGNSFSFTQNNSDSFSESAALSGGLVVQDNTATFSETMAGTETYGTGGTISGGSDSFTWSQSATDVDTLINTGDEGTIGSALNPPVTATRLSTPRAPWTCTSSTRR
jgi:hypothetical protein